MINFVVATLPEGQPIIDLFQLNKKKIINKKLIYYSDKMSLTVTGIGKINCIIGVTQTFYELGKKKNNVWINIGLAGHKTSEIGKIFLVNKAIDKTTQKVFYPFIGKFNFRMKECVTFEKVNNKYDRRLSDMECSGFFEAAKNFSSIELLQSIKIISDNEKVSINFKDKEEVYNIISKYNYLIKETCEELLKLREVIDEDFNSKINEQFEKVFNGMKFTFTEKQQMLSLLRLYLIKKRKINKKIFNLDMNGKHNIGILKKLLEL